MRVTKRTWTPEQMEKLRELIEQGASANRASVALGRTRGGVMAQARRMGLTFKSDKKQRAASAERI